jgi:hypothetical protein
MHATVVHAAHRRALRIVIVSSDGSPLELPQILARCQHHNDP